MTKHEIIKLIKESNIPQKAIIAIHAIIIAGGKEAREEEEHSILTNEKSFHPYNSSTFVSEIFY